MKKNISRYTMSVLLAIFLILTFILIWNYWFQQKSFLEMLVTIFVALLGLVALIVCLFWLSRNLMNSSFDLPGADENEYRSVKFMCGLIGERIYPYIAKLQIIDDVLKNLQYGLLLFNPPKIMEQGESVLVTVRLTRDRGIPAKVFNELLSDTLPIIDQVKVHNTMCVELAGDGFEIIKKK